MLVTFTIAKIGQLHLKSVTGISWPQHKLLQISVTNISLVRILIFNLMSHKLCDTNFMSYMPIKKFKMVSPWNPIARTSSSIDQWRCWSVAKPVWNWSRWWNKWHASHLINFENVTESNKFSFRLFLFISIINYF